MEEDRCHEQLKRIISIICHENNARRKHVQRRFNIIFCHTKRKGRRRPNCRTSDPHGTLLIDREQARDKFVGSPLRGHPCPPLGSNWYTKKSDIRDGSVFKSARSTPVQTVRNERTRSDTSRDLGKISVKNWHRARSVYSVTRIIFI